MKDNPLYLAFLWHMHQPFYKDALTGIYRLPWVRLHGTKDYLDMLLILKDYPSIKQNFNLVPSLLEQLKDYADGKVREQFLELSLKDPSELSEYERLFIIENFFLANWNTMIKPFPRYTELLQKRGLSVNRESLSRIGRYFSVQDIRDLQVLFNLVWIDPLFREKDPELKELVLKGSGYTEEDKGLVIRKHFEILKRIIPSYKEAAIRGQIELSISPFYHPILPLLYDTDCAKISIPGVRLPGRFRAPEDVRAQIKSGIEYFETLFGFRPSGMWPSEGSVSEEVIRECSQLGINWLATDEDVLSRSIGITLRDSFQNIHEPSRLYRPYIFENIFIFFRDHRLSDLIGFVYSGWKPDEAASDLIRRLWEIYKSFDDRPYIVSIILDGENAWEYYEDDGRPFLTALYEGISKEEWIKTITFRDYINKFYDEWNKEQLKRIIPGSWIYGNFSIWIGHEEDNLAWDYLRATRDELVRFQTENPDIDTSAAWRHIYIAEGSDWNWWYGDEHVTDTQEEFDELFRNNLIAVYRLINKEPPAYLFVPILREDRAIEPAQQIKGFISPKIDGLVSSYFEWLHAALIDIFRSGGSMHKTETFFQKLYYGFDRDNLYIRLDGKKRVSEILCADKVSPQYRIVIKFISPPDFKIVGTIHELSLLPEMSSILMKFVDGRWQIIKELMAGIDEIFEVAVPFEDLGVKENDEISFVVMIQKVTVEEIIERIPLRGHIRLTVPGPYFEAIMWQ